MLQQTQVETVVPYFERWIAEFPNISALATADEQSVLNLWAGLGYYSRARNLMAAAKIVDERSRRRMIPSDYEALRSLPGIGQYTAGAILSIAFNKPYPVVDGNVRRVLSRIYGWEDDSPKRLWEAAEKLVQQRGTAADQSGHHGARRDGVLVQGAALPGVPGSATTASLTRPESSWRFLR